LEEILNSDRIVDAFGKRGSLLATKIQREMVAARRQQH
jgi:hypothetical protein